MIVDLKFFTLFKAETLNSGMQSATDKFLLYSSPVTRHFRHAIGDEKFKLCRRGHFGTQCFAAKNVKCFQSTITYAVFYFFFHPKYDFSRSKIQYFPVQNITKKLSSDHENLCFRIPTGPQKSGFRARFPLKNFRQTFSGD